MDGDLSHLLVEHTHDARVPTNPNRSSKIFGRYGVVRLHHFDMTVTMDLALRFVKQGEWFAAQGTQRRPLDLLEHLSDMLASRPMNPRVGDGSFPVLQVLVLFLQVSERSSFESIRFDVPNAALDLPLVSRHIRFCRKERRAVVHTEVTNLRCQFRVVPVGMTDRSPQIVDHDRLRNTAKAPKRVLQASQKVLRGLARRSFAIPFAAVAQHDAEHMRLASATIGQQERGHRPIVDLCLESRRTFHATHRERNARGQLLNEATNAVITSRVLLIVHQILIDPLGAQLLSDLRLNDLTKWFAGTAATRLALLRCNRRCPSGCLCCNADAEIGPGGRYGWF